MADVFLAVQQGDRRLDKLVVLKRMFAHLAEQPELVRMFLDEARFAAAIRHPHVVQIYDVGLDEGLYIAMEYLSGETLDYVFNELRRRRDGPMPYPVACQTAADIADGLHSAHSATDRTGREQCIVHRDVSPSNLLMCYTGNAKVLDFGIAKTRFGREHSPPRTFRGKLPYSAPEQINGGCVTPRTDVFQLGVVLHELLTGRHLFAADSDEATLMAALHRPIPEPSRLNPTVPPELDALVLAALERDADKRLPSADLLSARLREILHGNGHHVGHGKAATWMRRTFARRRAERLERERLARRDDCARAPGVRIPPLFPEYAAGDEPITLPTLPAYRPPSRYRSGSRLRGKMVTGTAAVLIGALGLHELVGADARVRAAPVAVEMSETRLDREQRTSVVIEAREARTPVQPSRGTERRSSSRHSSAGPGDPQRPHDTLIRLRDNRDPWSDSD